MSFTQVHKWLAMNNSSCLYLYIRISVVFQTNKQVFPIVQHYPLAKKTKAKYVNMFSPNFHFKTSLNQKYSSTNSFKTYLQKRG